MHLPRTLRSVSVSFTCVALAAILLVGVAHASRSVRPAEQAASVGALRGLADHYRRLTWEYERAARLAPTPTSYSYRRSSDRTYLRWTIDSWTRRAYVARVRALRVIHRKLAVALPSPPGLRAPVSSWLGYSRRLALQLRKIYPGTVTRSFASARESSDRATLRLWQQRSAAAALAVSLHAAPHVVVTGWLGQAFLCIHHYEGAWTSNTGNGYFGGLQMDSQFMRTYGSDFVRRWGTADNWPSWAQIEVAVRAHEAGRGFSPWPNTARACGLI